MHGCKTPRCPKTEIDTVESAAVFQLGSGGDPNNRRNVRQSDLAGEPAVAVEPVDLAGDGDGSLLDAAMTLSVSVALSRLAGGASAKKLSISERKVGWFAFTARR
jgi:hypothetical protein